MAEQWAWLTAGMAVAVAWTGGRVAVPWLVQRAIDDGIDGDDALLPWVLIIVAAGVISGVFTSARRVVAFRTARLVESRLRRRIFAHVQRLHFAYHDTVQTGDLMSRANTDLQQFQNLFTMIPVTAGNVAVVAVVSFLLFSTNAGLAALSLVFLPLVTVLGRRYGRRLHPEVMAIQAESAELAAVVEESVAGVRVVKGFGAENLRASSLAVEAEDVYEASMRAARIRSRFLPAVELLPNLGLVVVLWWGGGLVLDGALTIGELVSFNIYLAMLIQPLRMLGMIIANAQRASAAGQRIQSVLQARSEVVDPPSPRSFPDLERPGRVEFRGVTFAYPTARTAVDTDDDGRSTTPAGVEPVLSSLDLVIEAGETVALVGATGSGKSTVARVLPRFYDLDAGSIRIDGIDITDLALDDLRRAVGLVFEETFLFGASIAENIAFARPDADRAEIEQAARLAGAHDFIAELDDGYDTLVGERGYSLSGGQRQRIAIARAALDQPRVLILDDATSAVDPTKEHEIRDALTEVVGRRTTIVIAHRPATIALADRVLLLDEGRIVDEGSHAELLARSERYRQVLAAAERDHDSEHGGLATTGNNGTENSARGTDNSARGTNNSARGTDNSARGTDNGARGTDNGAR